MWSFDNHKDSAILVLSDLNTLYLHCGDTWLQFDYYNTFNFLSNSAISSQTWLMRLNWEVCSMLFAKWIVSLFTFDSNTIEIRYLCEYVYCLAYVVVAWLLEILKSNLSRDWTLCYFTKKTSLYIANSWPTANRDNSCV